MDSQPPAHNRSTWQRYVEFAMHLERVEKIDPKSFFGWRQSLVLGGQVSKLLSSLRYHRYCSTVQARSFACYQELSTTQVPSMQHAMLVFLRRVSPNRFGAARCLSKTCGIPSWGVAGVTVASFRITPYNVHPAGSGAPVPMPPAPPCSAANCGKSPAPRFVQGHRRGLRGSKGPVCKHMMMNARRYGDRAQLLQLQRQTAVMLC